MKNKQDKLKLKIQALLNKTPENGATVEEAASAIEKAQQLMKDYMISEGDLNDPYLGQDCILAELELPRMGYK